jgi:hypothetical protein
MSAFIYQKAFILSASETYDEINPNDTLKHITNLSINKKSYMHPGQVSTDLLKDYLIVYNNICTVWREVVKAAIPFMKHQTSLHHFEFFGLDFIADESQYVWLLECNRLPGLESSTNNKLAEDELYDDMMASMLRLVLPHTLRLEESQDKGMWKQVSEPIDDCSAAGSNTFLNLFNWLAFFRKNGKKCSIVS